jgi:urease accessory protein
VLRKAPVCDHLQPAPHAPGSESLHVVRAGSRSIVSPDHRSMCMLKIVARVAAMPVETRQNLLTGASPISGGCILRLLGASAEVVGRAIRQYLAFVPALLGDDPWARKW